ncbi:MAG: hypothetical protein AAF968_18930 [Pseudomonadota bacterium]
MAVAYNAAKSAGRLARAKLRQSDEYDAAQEAGEVAGHGGGRNFKGEADNVETTASDLGLRRDEIHEARRWRDAERDDPGVIERTVREIADRGNALLTKAIATTK